LFCAIKREATKWGLALVTTMMAFIFVGRVYGIQVDGPGGRNMLE
jgi:hypothetical protein